MTLSLLEYKDENFLYISKTIKKPCDCANHREVSKKEYPKIDCFVKNCANHREVSKKEYPKIDCCVKNCANHREVSKKGIPQSRLFCTEDFVTTCIIQ